MVDMKRHKVDDFESPSTSSRFEIYFLFIIQYHVTVLLNLWVLTEQITTAEEILSVMNFVETRGANKSKWASLMRNFLMMLILGAQVPI